MTFGLSLPAFTQLHVFLSLVGILAGFIVIYGMIARRRFPLLTALFLVTTVLTSLTGFLFPFKGVTPGIVIGILSIIVLALAIVARYSRDLAGPWRGTYIITTVVAQFFNFLVLIVQSFEKVPSLHAMAPTQTEAPFRIAQLATLLLFVILGILAYRNFRGTVVVTGHG
jgi:hypothetical protein